TQVLHILQQLQRRPRGDLAPERGARPAADHGETPGLRKALGQGGQHRAQQETQRFLVGRVIQATDEQQLQALPGPAGGARFQAALLGTARLRVGQASGGLARRYRAATRAQSRWKTIATQRSEEHTSELQSRENLVCRLLLEK